MRQVPVLAPPSERTRYTMTAGRDVLTPRKSLSALGSRTTRSSGRSAAATLQRLRTRARSATGSRSPNTSAGCADLHAARPAPRVRHHATASGAPEPRPVAARKHRATARDRTGAEPDGSPPQAERTVAGALARGWPPPRAGRLTARATPRTTSRGYAAASSSARPPSPTTSSSPSSSRPTGDCTPCPTSARAPASFTAASGSGTSCPALGDYGVRELTPKRLTRFRAELEQAGVGTATVVKALTIVQSILSFAVSEEIVEYNAAAAVRKPRYTRAREPHIFLPAEVEQIRAKLDLRDRTLVSVLAYSGPRPEEVVCRLELGRRRRAERSATSTPSAIASAFTPAARAAGRGSARMVPRLGSARRQTHRCSPPTTAASGTRTTGATGARASGSGEPERQRARPHAPDTRRGRAAHRPGPVRATCARAT